MILAIGDLTTVNLAALDMATVVLGTAGLTAAVVPVVAGRTAARPMRDLPRRPRPSVGVMGTGIPGRIG
ncbi:hypothetical protein GCM10010116_47170 [Microbispora rosea subsp. aerata]|nr:hypothetical protein GCM10010116_47170 [Microbispora rosea subsp. aerata]GLJ84428.1 hypothetical protein GCM10017588_31560 [Microbispora rosea subsp. aerata]